MHNLLKSIKNIGNKNRPEKLHDCARLAASKFTDEELQLLKKTWADLADRSNGKGVDKDTFLQYLPINGLLGERLFVQFDYKKTESLDLDEFVTGLATICRGTRDEKIRFIFDMYAVSDDETVSKAEFATLLNQIPRDVLDHSGCNNKAISRNNSMMPNSTSSASSVLHDSEGEETLNSDNESEAGVVASSPYPGSTSGSVFTSPNYEDEVDAYTNRDVIEKTFEECDLEHCGRLHYEEFRMFVSRNPAIVDYFEDIMPYSGHKDTGPRGHPMMAGTHTHSRSKKEVLPHRKLHRASSTMKDDIGGVGSPRFRGSSKYNSFSPDIEASVGGAPLSRGSSISASPMGDDTSLNLFTKNDLNRAMNRMNSMAIQKQYSEDEGVGIASAADIGNLEKHDSEQVIQVRRNPNAKSSTNLTAEAVQGFSNSKKAESTQDDTLHQNDSNFESEVLTYMLLERAMNTTKNEDLQRVIREVIDHIPGFNRSMVGDANAGTGENLTYHVPMYGNYNPFAENEKTEENEAEISMEGFLWKKGKFLHLWSKRWYILSGNCIYYYDSNNKDDMALKGVVFLTGCLVSELHDVDNEVKGYFGFELTHQDLTAGENHKHERRTFYCESEENRALWINKLQHAAQVVPIEDDYVIGAELGKGRFSIVYDCVHIRTKEHCAVKVIDKTTIEAEDRGLLRTEIAVLKIVDHPNIIKMCGIYESKKYIYIVMEKLSGGELFERIVGRPRFTEVEAAKLIVPLLEAVAYLHDLGIAHRDLKPENILCSEGKVDDIKIADFGLSKMVLPEEKMMGACGTLSYVAPEVLSMQGYGVQADVWSVGVILFLILCGKLPFDGDDSNDIIRKTVQCEPSVNPNVWNKFSDDTKNILSCMLKKDPSKRITARECLKHPFIVINCAAPSPAVPGGVSAPASNANA